MSERPAEAVSVENALDLLHMNVGALDDHLPFRDFGELNGLRHVLPGRGSAPLGISSASGERA